ncbi:MAG: hypothetical protein AAGN82_02875 [Myxococcota bacterium]
MRRGVRAIASAGATGFSLLVVVAAPRVASADSMDPALARLTLDDNCRTGSSADGTGQFYNPASGFNRCRLNHAAFAKLVAQLGTAIAPLPTYSARTTGFGGYRFGVLGQYTTIDSGAHYWREGTQGPRDESTGQDSVRNDDPDSILQNYQVFLAKGFPFGLELGAGFGYLVNTQIVSAGGDVRLSLFEGFRSSIPGYFPDVGVGGSVRTITGSSELKLTVASFDAQLSKPIPIAGTVVLQPRVGYQFLFMFGDSGLVDLTPNTDPNALCGYQGDNTPATPDPDKGGVFDGQPVCSGSSADFNNNVVFDRVRLARHRINFGSTLRYQMLQFGFHVATDVVRPGAVNDGDTVVEDALDPDDPSGNTTFRLNKLEDDPRTEGDDAVKNQWTFGFEVGAAF